MVSFPMHHIASNNSILLFGHFPWEIAVIILFAYIILSFGIGKVACSYKRSFWGWFFLSLGFSPLTAILFLAIADVPHKAVVREENEKSVRSRYPGKEDNEIRAIAEVETTCPHCDAPVNARTGDGIIQSEEQPWKLFCASCEKELPEDTLDF